jgi:hypothetical protein
MATVAESVKETLVGVDKPAGMSDEVRASWLQYSKTEEDGERYMDKEAFINAVTPPDEDYVSFQIAQPHARANNS